MSPSPLWMVWCPEIETRHIDKPGIPSHILGQRISVLAELVSLEIYFRLEDDELLLETLPVQTQEMVLLEMLL
jgi:hypothetical protein